MGLRRDISEAASEARDAAGRIGESVQWNTTALLAITVVAVAALIAATTALVRAGRD